MYLALCVFLDVAYDKRPIQRFWFLETVARMVGAAPRLAARKGGGAAWDAGSLSRRAAVPYIVFRGSMSYRISHNCFQLIYKRPKDISMLCDFRPHH